MYIEKIIIENFKSYRGPITIGPFDPGYNVIVGRNGSGKSNFFKAIQFVLCEDYHKLSFEERSNFLHQGTSLCAPSGFVEIIFNNSDKQFPVESEEVTIRRAIGPNKDQYFLNKIRISKDEILELFASSGLSTRNPFHIIKQRQLLEIVISTDERRLKLLEDIAGVTLFESRCKKMDQLLDPIVNDLMRDDLFANVNRGLRQKELEQQDMNQYKELKKLRCMMEYLLSELELKKFTTLLTKVQPRYSEQRANLIEAQKKINSADEKISKLVSKVEGVKREIGNAKLNSRELITERQILVLHEKNWNVNVEHLTDSIRKDKETQEEIRAELLQLTESIDKYNADLIPIKTKYETAKAREDKITHDLAVAEQLQKELILKKHRKSTFKSRNERDAWIKEQMKLLDARIKDSDAYRVKYEKELEVERGNKRDLEDKILKLKQNYKAHLTSTVDFERKLYDRKNDAIQYHKIRKNLFEKKDTNDNQLKYLNNELKKVDQALKLNKDILNGRDSVAKVLDILREQLGNEEVENNYLGMVVDNFSAMKDLYTAIELTAGNRLFGHIVATDAFGMKILDEMNKNDLPGVVTFWSINRLTVKNRNYPEDDEARGLLYNMEFEEKVDPVMDCIFGDTLVCKDLEICAQAADKYKLNCITLSGGKVSAQGDLAGGFIGNRKSTIETHKARYKILEKIKTTENELMKIGDEFQRVEREFNENLTEISKLEIKSMKGKFIQEEIRKEIHELNENQRYLEKRCAETEKTLEKFVTTLEIVRSNKEHLESELQQDLLSQLAEEEQRQFEEVHDDIVQLRCEKYKLVDELIHLSDEKYSLEKLLKKDLLKKTKLEESLQELTVDIEKHNAELQWAKKEADELRNKIDNINKGVDNDKLTNLVKFKIQLDEEIKNEVESKNENLQNYRALSSSVNELETKMNDYQEKIKTSKEKLKRLNPTMPRDNPQLSCGQLNRRLRDINANLKRFKNINIEVLHQFETITERNEELIEARDKLLDNIKEVTQFRQLVDDQKAEVILSTFQQMNEYFDSTFKKLVPSGSAKLIMKINEDNDVDFEDISVELVKAGNFTGVGIDVSFNAGRTKNLEQFSSGQKSLIALAFILAAQNCNFTPFYILDESDYALDSEHRKRVAKLIGSLSNEIQFISTTFRPEQLEHADVFFGVQIRDKVSYLQKISKNTAIGFVEN